MHLSSTLNPRSATEEDIPVAIFRYNDQKKFLHLSDDYKDMLNIIYQAFNIAGQPVSLQTSSLDACKGESVEIDESAYGFMLSVLDVVDVIVEVEEDLVNPDQPRDTDEGSLVSFPTRSPSSSQTPSSPRSSPDSKARERSHASGSRSALPPNEDVAEEKEVERMDEFAPLEGNAQAEYVVGSKTVAEVADEDMQGSWTLQDNTMNPEFTPNRQKFKPVSKPIVAAEPDVFTATVKKEKEVTPNRATKDLPKITKTPRQNITTTTTATAADTFIDPDSRFEISILGPGPNQVAQFKTRGRHSVGKVLSAACKTFGVDPARARLFQKVTPEDGDEVCEIECEIDETMAQYNGVPQLYIRLDPVIEDDDELMNFN